MIIFVVGTLALGVLAYMVHRAEVTEGSAEPMVWPWNTRVDSNKK